MRRLASNPFTILRLAIGAAVLSVAPLAAQAQEAIATAVRSPDGGAPTQPMADRPLRIDDGADDGPGFLRPRGPCGGPAKTADGRTDKTPHGEVWAGVGTRGYREVGGAVCVPVGDNAAVSIAIDAGQIDGRRRRR